ncbi:membrane protein [Streptomyces sp. F-3]|uniref:Uncharacterized protein n=1 Tax=Streptomyces thermogriseus TaxID=75292 RepID=A0ABN1T2M5_9ACTN|nr:MULTISPECIES: DUF5819 family protein [Streptomyces]MDN5384517.1 DUF5819 family protein [Streptomyces sp. LB8]GAT84298.1 membrane protein [Streptomyces sp. F-3]
MDAHDEDSNVPHGRRGPRGTAGAPSPGGAGRTGAAPARPEGRPGGSPGPDDGPDGKSDDGPADGPEDGPGPVRGGVAALPPPYRIGAALALAVVALVVCAHLGMVFLHVAPSNTVSKQHGKAIGDWIYPEFEQNWKLFAPNPLQQNIAVQARAEIRTADGGIRTTGWYDLSAQDGRAIDGNVVPSHTQQNMLRRAWELYGATHDSDNRPVGLHGTLAEQYLRRIVVLRLHRARAAGADGVVERVQVRCRIAEVPPPAWSKEKARGRPEHRQLPWWTVPADESRGGLR